MTDQEKILILEHQLDILSINLQKALDEGKISQLTYEEIVDDDDWYITNFPPQYEEINLLV